MPVVHVNGIDVNYVDEGQGEVLVLVHNLISSIHGYDFNIPVFSKYFRTIAYDLRGHGLSSKPEGGYTFDNMAEDLYQLLRALNVESCYLLGTAAVGRGVIFTFHLKHPEMVKALIPVSGGTLSETGRETAAAGETSRAEVATRFGRLQQIAREQGMMAVFEYRKQDRLFWTQKILDSSEILSRFEVMYQQTAVDAFVNLPERLSPQQRQQLIDALKTHVVPVLQLVGVEDVTPEQTIASMKSICPRFHGLILPESGHYPAIENPDDFNQAVLNFLAGVRAYG